MKVCLLINLALELQKRAIGDGIRDQSCKKTKEQSLVIFGWVGWNIVILKLHSGLFETFGIYSIPVHYTCGYFCEKCLRGTHLTINQRQHTHLRSTYFNSGPSGPKPNSFRHSATSDLFLVISNLRQMNRTTPEQAPNATRIGFCTNQINNLFLSSCRVSDSCPNTIIWRTVLLQLY